MKNRTKLPNVYLGFLLALMYVPILLVIIYSFNESKLSSVWGGFSLKWYAELFRDRDLFQALWNSIVLGVISSCSAAVIGTLGAYGMSKVNFPLKGVVEYVSTLPMMIPEIIMGMVSMVFFSLIGIPFGDKLSHRRAVGYYTVGDDRAVCIVAVKSNDIIFDDRVWFFIPDIDQASRRDRRFHAPTDHGVHLKTKSFRKRQRNTGKNQYCQ